MKRMKKILITSVLTVAAGALIAPLGSSVLAGKASNTPTWNEIAIETQYVRDEVISIPDRYVSINGNQYDASIKLEYPNGTKMEIESGDMKLDSPGQYTLIYEAKADSETYTEEVDFLVADKLWSYKKSNTTVEYGKVGDTSCLLVGLAANDVLTFNKIIDLSTLKATDTLIKGFINPETVGTYEFDKLIFTLTDATDSTQTLTFRGNRSSTNNQRFASYWTSAGANQTLSGWDNNASRYSTAATVQDGICGTVATNASFYSQNGSYNPVRFWDVTADKCSFTLSYDSKEVKTFINGNWMSDLDNAEYYEKEPLWYGFPSNKVFLSVRVDGCAAERVNFCLSKIYDYDLTAENKFMDSDAPDITVNVEEKYVSFENGTYQFIPTALVGCNFPVPKATGFDMYSGDLKVETKVYFDYNNSKVERSIINGTFLVNKAGKYTIVYKAVDAMGNVTEKLYWITATKTAANPLTLTVDTQDAQTSGVCGEKIDLAKYSVSGGGGDSSVSITAKNGTTVLDVSNGMFLPEEAGVWTIEYVAKDFVGSVRDFSYEITIDWGTKPVFVDEPVLPRYLLANVRYTVPTVLAYDYSTGTKTECIAQMTLVDANGTVSYNAGDTFIPAIAEGSSSVTMTFTVGGASYEKTIPMVEALLEGDRGRINFFIENMFLGENFTAERNRDGLTLLAQEDGNISWIYANPVAAEGASINVKGIKGQSEFEGFKVTFTDYEDSNIAVTMNVYTASNGYLWINFGDTHRELKKGFNIGNDENGNALDEFYFAYKFGKFYVDSIAVTVANDDNGNPFNGFPSKKVYISTEVIGVASGDGYIVEQFDNNVITSSTMDRTAPRIAIDGIYGGIHKLNGTYVVEKAIASDTLDMDVSCFVTVRTPDGELVKDVNGLLLENVSTNRAYTIELKQYGQYSVEYTAQDFNNNVGPLVYTVNVFDRKAPTATVADTWSATAKVGDTVVLPEIYIEDDFSSIAEMKVYRMVRNPYGDVRNFGYDYKVLSDGSIQYIQYSFTFTNVGDYKFINVVYDETGNQKLVEYVVRVEA
ncbi:MAG: hypothetical protein IJV83_00175 [Clostridia bacterium]|nr:hypothetical protein [Clostridia bacterium]